MTANSPATAVFPAVPLTAMAPSPPSSPSVGIRFPKAGLLWLLLFSLLLTLGLSKRVNLLVLLACPPLILWALNAWLAGWGLRRLTGRRAFVGPIFAGTPFAVRVTVVNLRRRAWFAVRINDPDPAGPLSWFLPSLDGGQTVALAGERLLARRGRHTAPALVAASGHPFGLVQRTIELAPAEEMIVLPRLGRLNRSLLRRFLAGASPVARETPGKPQRRLAAQTELHGLRPFRFGDSPRWIHWRTTARRGELMVREFEDAPGDHLILVVDPALPSPSEIRAEGGAARRSRPLEDALSLAATVCWEWCRRPGERFLLAVAGAEPVMVDGDTGPAFAVRLLESLAVETGLGCDPGLAADRLARRRLPAAPVLLVSAGDDRLGDALAARLNRPVARLSAADLDRLDFYERPVDLAP
jgi:uncharacterized protein (DUF58 family)